MSKRVIGLAAAFCIAILGTLAYLLTPPAARTVTQSTPKKSDEKQQPVSERHVAFQEPGGTSWPDDPFFVYDRAAPNFNQVQNNQTHGSQDKVGVFVDIMNAYSNEVDDFMVIGAANAARIQYLAEIGQPVTNPQSKWLVRISEVGLVNGQVRVKVIASAGWDVIYEGRQTMESDGAVIKELWSLDTIGSNPTLLDRTKWRFNGLQTHQESPVTIYIPPPGTPSVPFGPAPTDNDMGTIGEPYGGGDGSQQP